MLHSVSHIRVRYAETDQMRFAYHGHYITWFETARIGLFDKLGYPYTEVEAAGLFLPVLSVGAEYRLPARFDDRLEIHVFLRERPRLRITLDYRVERSGELLATGQSSHAFMNDKGQAIRPPAFFTALLDAHWAQAAT